MIGNHNINRRKFFNHSAIAAASLAAGTVLPGIFTAANGVPLEFFNLGIIADEVDQDLEKGLLFVREFGLRWIELRNIEKTYVTDIDDQTAQKAKQLIEKYNIRVSVIDTAFLKCKLPGTTLVKEYRDSYPYEEQYNMLKRACERAVFFSAPYVRIFTFWRIRPEL